MAFQLNPSELRVEKQRASAILILSSGQSTGGCFFIGTGSARHAGPERVGDVLNSEPGFFPFEVHDGDDVSTVLFNRRQVVMVVLAENEASDDPGYDLATRRVVSVVLSNGQRQLGAVRIYRPAGRDRLSDWARQPETFRYLETTDATLIINMDHVIDVHEVPEP